jgi:hypothetical protein
VVGFLATFCAFGCGKSAVNWIGVLTLDHESFPSLAIVAHSSVQDFHDM